MLDVDVSLFENLSECRQVGSQSITARLADGREIRVTAGRELGLADAFSAEYEELVLLETLAAEHLIWVQADFPAAYGKSVADCLNIAFGWLNEVS